MAQPSVRRAHADPIRGPCLGRCLHTACRPGPISNPTNLNLSIPILQNPSHPTSSVDATPRARSRSPIFAAALPSSPNAHRGSATPPFYQAHSIRPHLVAFPDLRRGRSSDISSPPIRAQRPSSIHTGIDRRQRCRLGPLLERRTPHVDGLAWPGPKLYRAMPGPWCSPWPSTSRPNELPVPCRPDSHWARQPICQYIQPC